ncbi:MAG: hypothetical protein JWN21_2448 [Sphingomonas bacterium]|nr:hypothetical protein [Sphingomonas bacterium]
MAGGHWLRPRLGSVLIALALPLLLVVVPAEIMVMARIAVPGPLALAVAVAGGIAAGLIAYVVVERPLMNKSASADAAAPWPGLPRPGRSG